MKRIRTVGLIATLMLAGALTAATARADQDSKVADAVQKFKATNPRIQRLFNEAYGYAVFPAVDKAAIGIGGAEGRGEVFQNGILVGKAKLTQATVGAQLGGESYSEVIFFETEKALDEFKDGKTAVSAALSAVVADDGAAAEAKYQHGVIVCAIQRSGLMFEASVGGQHFKFTSLSENNPTPGTMQTAPTGAVTPGMSAEPPPTPSSPSSTPQ